MKPEDFETPEDLCGRVGATPLQTAPGDRLGLSRSARTDRPVHGRRVAPGPGASGWFVWAGDWSDADDFFEPTHAAHIPQVCPLASLFLSLPPGWRFLTDGDYVDVWFDPAILHGTTVEE